MEAKKKDLVIKEFQTLPPDCLYVVGDAFLEEKGLVDHHTRSANEFYKKGVRHIITHGFNIKREMQNLRTTTEEDKSIASISCSVNFTNVTISKPQSINTTTSHENPIMPCVALAYGRIYSGKLSVSFTVEAVATLVGTGQTIKRTETVQDYGIAKLPILKGSDLCHTTDMPKETLYNLGESIDDPNGYLITRYEYGIDCTESIAFNTLKIYNTINYKNALVRADFLSKPGDGQENSDMVILTYYNDGRFTIQVSRNKLMKVEIPFYTLFRALGWTTDKKFFDWIVQDYSDDLNKNIFSILVDAMNVSYGKVNYREITDSVGCLEAIVGMIPDGKYPYLDLKNNKDHMHNAIEDVNNTLDKYFLPHIGLTSATRNDKLRFLARMIRKVLMVHLKYAPATDRDSLSIKRIHAAGENLAKTFKQIWNRCVAITVKKQIGRVFKESPFSQVNLAQIVRNGVNVDNFENTIIQTIMSGNKANININRDTIVNRLKAQQIYRQNPLKVLATLRQISSTNSESAKQSERAAEMRRVRFDATGFICMIHSPTEGEHVGINKQMAMFASIAPASSSSTLKQMLQQEPILVMEEDMKNPEEIYRERYTPVHVNGHLIAYTKEGTKLVNKYKQLRRNLEIDAYTTIYWDRIQDEIHFFVDIGRMIRPLTIVYNNKRDPEVRLSDPKYAFRPKKEDYATPEDFENFYQYVALTLEDVRLLQAGKKKAFDLLVEKKIEYISPEEQENCLIAPNLRVLEEAKHNAKIPYTHVDIEQAILGITAMATPFGQHNQGARTVYETAQRKQTCGIYTDNYPKRYDKDTFVSYISENPLILTRANKYTPPDGSNCVMAIACYSGQNQEDSIVMSKASEERQLHRGSKFDFMQFILDTKERIGIPDARKTEGRKDGNYSKLVNGIVQPGTILENGDIMIAKYIELPKSSRQNDRIYLDKSEKYSETEPAIVQKVLISELSDEPFVKIGIRKIRNTVVGDKFCLLPTAQVLTQNGWKQISKVGQDDMVATLMPSGYMAYATQKVVSFDYSGKLYTQKSADFITLCTPEHKNMIRFNNDSQFQMVQMQECFGRKFTFRSGCLGLTEKRNSQKTKDRDENGTEDVQQTDIQTDLNVRKLGLTFDENAKAYRITSTSFNFDKSQQELLEMGYCLSQTTINNEKLISITPNFYEHQTNSKSERYIHYNGKVWCLEVPLTHNFYYRESQESLPIWTGNSTRAGQKGIVALMMDEADMPSTVNGIRPDIIFNPHGLPSRMTMATLLEVLVGKVCALKGMYYDGTIFQPVNENEFADQLEQLGFDRGGYDYLISGITGEFIDTKIFFGPTFYQRLLKFVFDAHYSVRKAHIDPLTRQPMDGQANNGGLRIGEMERDVLISHGAASIFTEKYYKHSDEFVEYLCRCGMPAIANKRTGVYKCKFCRDNADIVAINTSWSAHLFMQELLSCGIGMRRYIKPYEFQTFIDEVPVHERYNDETIKNIISANKDMVGGVDAPQDQEDNAE